MKWVKPQPRFALNAADLLADPDIDVRREAAIALQKMGTAGAAFAKEVAVLLTDGDETIRQVGADDLDEWGNVRGYLDLQAALLSVTDDAPCERDSRAPCPFTAVVGRGTHRFQKSVTWLG